MKFLFWVLLVFLTFRFVFRFFGRQLVMLLSKVIAKNIQNDFKNQQQNYEKHHYTGPFQENVYQHEEVRVSAPKVNKQKASDVFEVAEEVDFEEIK
ncbi:MAG: hypothetical protein K1X92_10545 [Bacteroidia bacterium]|nr:hypothetical protein [Bacteroidia bacterium]